MSVDKPVHRVEAQSMLGDIQEALGKGFHIQSALATPSGSYKILGLNVGLSWNKLREKTTGPFVADAAPIETTTGMKLLEFTQARFYFEVVAGNGLEQLTFTVWHRHLNYPEGTTAGPWLRGKSYSNVLALSEVLDLAHYHREVYLQATVYTPNASTGTAIKVWVAGAEALQDPSFVDVKVDAGDIEVQIEAIPDDIGEKADSTIVAGTTDGAVPTAAGGAPTKTFATRVMPDGRTMPYLQELLLASVFDLYEINETLDRTNGLLRLLNGRDALGQARQLARTPFQTGFRKLLGIDGGAVVVTDVVTLSFTGVNLTGKVDTVYDLTTGTEHKISVVVDPAGGAVGTLTLKQPLWSVLDTVLVPYLSAPHAWNSATDALQTLAVAGDPPRINGWAPFISATGAAATWVDGTNIQQVLPVANYGRYGIQIVWSTAAGTRMFTFRSYSKQDDAAWAGVGTIPAGYGCDNVWSYGTGSAHFGDAPVAAGIIEAWMNDTKPFNSMAIEVVVSGTDANNSTVTAGETLYGGTK